jgi:hypothetical protein
VLRACVSAAITNHQATMMELELMGGGGAAAGGSSAGEPPPFPGGARGFWEAIVHMLAVSIKAPDKVAEDVLEEGPCAGIFALVNVLLIIGILAPSGAMLIVAIPFWLVVFLAVNMFCLKGGDATPEQAAIAFVSKLEGMKPELQEYIGIDGMLPIHKPDVMARLESVLRRNRMLFLQTDPVYYGEELRMPPGSLRELQSRAWLEKQKGGAGESAKDDFFRYCKQSHFLLSIFCADPASALDRRERVYVLVVYLMYHFLGNLFVRQFLLERTEDHRDDPDWVDPMGPGASEYYIGQLDRFNGSMVSEEYAHAFASAYFFSKFGFWALKFVAINGLAHNIARTSVTKMLTSKDIEAAELTGEATDAMYDERYGTSTRWFGLKRSGAEVLAAERAAVRHEQESRGKTLKIVLAVSAVLVYLGVHYVQRQHEEYVPQNTGCVCRINPRIENVQDPHLVPDDYNCVNVVSHTTYHDNGNYNIRTMNGRPCTVNGHREGASHTSGFSTIPLVCTSQCKEATQDQCPTSPAAAPMYRCTFSPGAQFGVDHSCTHEIRWECKWSSEHDEAAEEADSGVGMVVGTLWLSLTSVMLSEIKWFGNALLKIYTPRIKLKCCCLGLSRWSRERDLLIDTLDLLRSAPGGGETPGLWEVIESIEQHPGGVQPTAAPDVGAFIRHWSHAHRLRKVQAEPGGAGFRCAVCHEEMAGLPSRVRSFADKIQKHFTDAEPEPVAEPQHRYHCVEGCEYDVCDGCLLQGQQANPVLSFQTRPRPQQQPMASPMRQSPESPTQHAHPHAVASVSPFEQGVWGGGDGGAVHAASESEEGEDAVFVVEGSRHAEINGSYRRQRKGLKPDKYLYVKCGCENFPRVRRGGGQWQMEVETTFLGFKTGSTAKHTKWPSMADQPPLTGWGSGVTVRYV